MDNKHKSISYAKWGYIFIAPFIIVFILCQLIPLFSTFYNSFFENYMDGLNHIGPNFVGFDNYVKLFTPSSNGKISILSYTWNTMFMWILGAVPQLVFSLLLAVIFTSARLWSGGKVADLCSLKEVGRKDYSSSYNRSNRLRIR